jgi:hypothetical protein
MDRLSEAIHIGSYIHSTFAADVFAVHFQVSFSVFFVIACAAAVARTFLIILNPRGYKKTAKGVGTYLWAFLPKSGCRTSLLCWVDFLEMRYILRAGEK